MEKINVQVLSAFFQYCDDLEKHPFYAALANGGRLSLTNDRVEFDLLYLETLVTRLRQFFSEREAFFYKNIRKAMIAVGLAENKQFRQFYDKVIRIINSPFPASKAITVYRSDNTELIQSNSFVNLAQTFLYLGPLHSEKLISPTPREAGVHDAPWAKAWLSYYVAIGSIACVRNVLIFRNWILFTAREQKKVNLFKELAKFDERMRAAGF